MIRNRFNNLTKYPHFHDISKAVTSSRIMIQAQSMPTSNCFEKSQSQTEPEEKMSNDKQLKKRIYSTSKLDYPRHQRNGASRCWHAMVSCGGITDGFCLYDEKDRPLSKAVDISEVIL